MLDTKALAQATAAIVKEHVDAAVAPLIKRIKELEERGPLKGEPGAAGKDGLSVTVDDVAPMISEVVRSAVAAIPAPKDGADGKDGANGRDGVDGKSVSIDEIEPIIASHIRKAISAIPAPKDGKDGRDGANGKDGSDGKDGRDGLGAASAMIDRSGHLILTMTNGSAKDLGPVVGKDGADGVDGKDGAPGACGKDGSDGIGFDDMDMVETDEGLNLRFVRGDVVKEFLLPVPTDHGVWKEKLFRKGQGVTWGGSFWIAQRDTDKKPDSPDSGWRLAVKRGRDGKDGLK